MTHKDTDTSITSESINNEANCTLITDEEITNLASLTDIEYEQVRTDIAEAANIRVSKLDEAVKKAKTNLAVEEVGKHLFQNVEPWHEPVELPALLNEIEATILRYVSFQSKYEAKAIALWVVYTYCIDAAFISPILFVTSPEMRSGKSTLLSILQRLCSRCISASSVTSSSLFRIITKHKPTILCDEADTYLNHGREDLRNIFNAGHSRDSSKVLRTNLDSMDVDWFDSFGAKCIAGINRIPNTIEDRSIIINLKRMHKGEKKEKMRLVDKGLRNHFNHLQGKCLRFANDNIDKIMEQMPAIPERLNDRAADNWYTMFQIAELADVAWQRIIASSALHLSGCKEEVKSIGVELLEHVADLFDNRFQFNECVLTNDLVDALCEDEEAPWATYNYKNSQNQKISARQLKSLLKPYGIESQKNIGAYKRRGYLKSSFHDAFKRYIPDWKEIHVKHALYAPGVNQSSSKNNIHAPVVADRADKIDLNSNDECTL